MTRTYGGNAMHSHVEEGSCGTELNIVQEGISELIPTEACYLGWQKSLTLLAKLIDRDPATGQPTAAGALGLSLVAVSGCCA
jgi:hypothetical protein